MSLFTASDPPALIAHGNMGGVGAWHLFDLPSTSSSQQPASASNSVPYDHVKAHAPVLPSVIRPPHQKGGFGPMHPTVIARPDSIKNKQWQGYETSSKPFERLSYLKEQLAGFDSLQSTSSLPSVPHDLLIDTLNQDIDECISDHGSHGCSTYLLETVLVGPSSHLIVSGGGGAIGDHITLTLINLTVEPSEAMAGPSSSSQAPLPTHVKGCKIRSLHCSEVSVGREVLELTVRPLPLPSHTPPQSSPWLHQKVLIAARCGYCVNILVATPHPSDMKSWRMDWVAKCTPSPPPSPHPSPRTSHVSWCPILNDLAITLEDGSIFLTPPLPLPAAAASFSPSSPELEGSERQGGGGGGGGGGGSGIRVDVPSVRILGPWGGDEEDSPSPSSLPPLPSQPSSWRSKGPSHHPPPGSSSSSSLSLQRSGLLPPRSTLMTLQGHKPRVILCAQGPHLFTLALPNHLLPSHESGAGGGGGTGGGAPPLPRPTLIFTLPCEDKVRDQYCLAGEGGREVFRSLCPPSPSPSSSSYGSHLMALGTTERILLIDMRAPNTPLMQWKIDPALVDPMHRLGPKHISLTLIDPCKGADEDDGGEDEGSTVLGTIFYLDEGGSLMSHRFTLSPPRYGFKVDRKSQILVRREGESIPPSSSSSYSSKGHASTSVRSQEGSQASLDRSNLSPAMRVLSRVAGRAKRPQYELPSAGWKRPLCFASHQSQGIVSKVDRALGQDSEDQTAGMKAIFKLGHSTMEGGDGGGGGGMMMVLRSDVQGRVFAQAFDVVVKKHEAALIQFMRGIPVEVEEDSVLNDEAEEEEEEEEEAKDGKERSWSGFILLPTHMTHLSAMLAARHSLPQGQHQGDKGLGTLDQLRPSRAISSIIEAASGRSKNDLEYIDPWKSKVSSKPHDWGIRKQKTSVDDQGCSDQGGGGGEGEGRELAVALGNEGGRFLAGSNHLPLLLQKASCPLTEAEISSRLISAPLHAAALASLTQDGEALSSTSQQEADWLLLTSANDANPNPCSPPLHPMLKPPRSKVKGAFRVKKLLSAGVNRALLRLVVMDGGWWTASCAEGKPPADAQGEGDGGRDEGLAIVSARKRERKSSIVENEKRAGLITALSCPWHLLTLPKPFSQPPAGPSTLQQGASPAPSPWIEEAKREEEIRRQLHGLATHGMDHDDDEEEEKRVMLHGSVAYGPRHLSVSRAKSDHLLPQAMETNDRETDGNGEGGDKQGEEAGPSNRPPAPAPAPSFLSLPSRWRKGMMDLPLPPGPLDEENATFLKELEDSWPMDHPKLMELGEGGQAQGSAGSRGIDMKVQWSRSDARKGPNPDPQPLPAPPLLLLASTAADQEYETRSKRAKKEAK